jgi:hypothetical protein
MDWLRRGTPQIKNDLKAVAAAVAALQGVIMARDAVDFHWTRPLSDLWHGWYERY